MVYYSKFPLVQSASELAKHGLNRKSGLVLIISSSVTFTVLLPHL